MRVLVKLLFTDLPSVVPLAVKVNGTGGHVGGTFAATSLGEKTNIWSFYLASLSAVRLIVDQTVHTSIVSFLYVLSLANVLFI